MESFERRPGAKKERVPANDVPPNFYDKGRFDMGRNAEAVDALTDLRKRMGIQSDDATSYENANSNISLEEQITEVGDPSEDPPIPPNTRLSKKEIKKLVAAYANAEPGTLHRYLYADVATLRRLYDETLQNPVPDPDQQHRKELSLRRKIRTRIDDINQIDGYVQQQKSPIRSLVKKFLPKVFRRPKPRDV